MTQRKLEQIINESIQKRLNEIAAMRSETNNIQNVINELESIYNNVLRNGLSMREISVNQINRMIVTLKQIKRRWQNMDSW